MDLMDLMDLMDQMLYLKNKVAHKVDQVYRDLLQRFFHLKKATANKRTTDRTTHGFSGDCQGAKPLDRSGNAPDRYPLFFAKLFFLPKKKRIIFWLGAAGSRRL